MRRTACARAQNGRYSTALPSNLGAAASWDVQASCDYGALIGRELRAQGYNMTLGGGTNLAREPRNGRTFEYMGEDPVLAGTMVGNRIKCEQGQHIVGDIKHFAINDQEAGRTEVDSVMDHRAMHESDLLAFEIGLSIGKPAAVMCSYNSINGDYACENKYTLTDVLRDEWKFLIRSVRLGRDAQHGAGFACRARYRGAGRGLLRREAKDCRRERRRLAGGARLACAA